MPSCHLRTIQPFPYRTPEDLQLRSGDILDASVQTIDQNRRNIQSSLTETTFIPHHAIRSVELKNPFRGKEIDRKKMERLLTVRECKRSFLRPIFSLPSKEIITAVSW